MEYEIVTERLPRQPYAAIRTTTAIASIGEVMGPLYGRLFGWLGQAGIAPACAPWTRYLLVGPEDCELEAGVPLAAETAGDSGIIGGVMPACETVRTLHVGPYDQLGHAYSAIAHWLEANHYHAAGAMWEVYLTDPTTEPDAANWRTLVYCPASPESA